MLSVKNLSKAYPSFRLQDISFSLSPGYIMGFIGTNGAGKTTTLKSILNIVSPDEGSVEIFGMDMKKDELEIKQDIGFMLGGADYYPHKKVKTIISVYKRFFKHWDDNAFASYLKKFAIDENKKIKELSAGMKVKLSVAMALSHGARLIILDEPTSGLDPVARDELLDIFRETIENGDKSILFSTHITSDLDKCADYILFIKNGKIITQGEKDEIIASHKIVRGSNDELSSELEKKLIGLKKNAYGFSGIIKTSDMRGYEKLAKETPNLEDIMVYFNREETI